MSALLLTSAVSMDPTLALSFEGPLLLVLLRELFGFGVGSGSAHQFTQHSVWIPSSMSPRPFFTRHCYAQNKG